MVAPARASVGATGGGGAGGFARCPRPRVTGPVPGGLAAVPPPGPGAPPAAWKSRSMNPTAWPPRSTTARPGAVAASPPASTVGLAVHSCRPNASTIGDGVEVGIGHAGRRVEPYCIEEDGDRRRGGRGTGRERGGAGRRLGRLSRSVGCRLRRRSTTCCEHEGATRRSSGRASDSAHLDGRPSTGGNRDGCADGPVFSCGRRPNDRRVDVQVNDLAWLEARPGDLDNVGRAVWRHRYCDGCNGARQDEDEKEGKQPCSNEGGRRGEDGQPTPPRPSRAASVPARPPRPSRD